MTIGRRTLMFEDGVRERLKGAWDRITSWIGANAISTSDNGGEAPAREASPPLRRLWAQTWRGTAVGDADAYRRLTFHLLHQLPGGTSRSVLVTTPNRSDAAGSASMELARSMADELRRPVLLVDASEGLELRRRGRDRRASSGSRRPVQFVDASEGPDLRRPDRDRRASGLMDLIADPNLRLEDLVIPTSHEDVYFLPRGTLHNAPASATPEVTRALARIAERFNFMVVSGGGILSNGLGLLLGGHVGHVLLLVSEGHTHMNEIDSAQSILRLCKADNVTVVLTERSGAAP